MENLLDQLAQIAREETLEASRRLDERWDRLAGGLASDAEIDELRGMADASGEHYEAYQAFKPLGPDFEQRVVSAIVTRLDIDRARPLAAAEAEVAALATPPPPATFGRKLYALYGGLGAAMVAAALFLLLPSGPMPHYILREPPSLQANRGLAEIPLGAPIVADGMYLDLEAIAAFEPETLPAAQLFVAKKGLPLEPCSLEPRIGTDGRVIFYLKIGADLELPFGESKLVLVLGRPGSLPTGEELLRAVQRGGEGTRNWQVLVQPIIKGP